MKYLKNALFTLISALAFAQLLHGQAIQTTSFPVAIGGGTRQQDITIPAGQVFKLLSWGPSASGPTSLKVDGILVPIAYAPSSTNPAPPVFSPNLVIAGPRTISLEVQSNLSLVCSYILIPNTDVPVQSVPSTSVVIPADVSGPVQVILESSTDLITWTAANPGSYGSSTVKRFFRVRTITQ